ncbi:MAG: GHKL domain-containing protein [Blastocatellia bacterium]|nr:GHKL domain-containing protein [Blastocatellia bacterium]
MRLRLGSSVTLIAVFLMFGLGAVNLITISLYGKMSMEATKEKELKQRQEIIALGFRISSLINAKNSTTDLFNSRLDQLSSEYSNRLSVVTIYNPEGKLQLEWFNQLSIHNELQKSQLESLLPDAMPLELFGVSEPCSQENLTTIGKAKVEVKAIKIQNLSYNLFILPVIYSTKDEELVDCIGYAAIVFRTETNRNSWPLLTSFLQIITITLVAVSSFIFLRTILRPVFQTEITKTVNSDSNQFIFQSLQELIDSLQIEKDQLEKLHDQEKERIAFVEQFNERIVASIPSGLVAITPLGYVLLANRRAREIAAKVEVVKPLQLRYEEFFDSVPRLCELIEDCLRNGRKVELEEVEKKNGKTLAITVSPLSWSRRETDSHGALCLISDLTEVVELRQRVHFQEHLASLGEMAAGIAHEFKNSLAIISGYSQLLQSVSKESVAQTSAKALVDETNNLSQVVTDFLNFARPQNLQLSPLNLQELLQDCSDAVVLKSKSSSVEISIVGDFGDVLGDYTLLRRAFLNLLENAIEAITDSVAVRKVTITGFVELSADKKAVIEVSDTGVGIPTADLNCIFVPFFTTKSRGYGIGLALVQKIFLAHQGSVKVKSREGEGTTFTCTLPMINVQALNQ